MPAFQDVLRWRLLGVAFLLGVLSPSLVTAEPSDAKAIARSAAEDPAKLEFFEKRIRPILVDNCFSCHSATTNSKGGLRVDDLNGLMTGGSSGAAIVPGNAEDSLLLSAVKYEAFKMPP